MPVYLDLLILLNFLVDLLLLVGTNRLSGYASSGRYPQRFWGDCTVASAWFPG